MGSSEEGNPPLKAQNEINLGTSSNGTRHDVVEADGDCQDQNQNPLAMEETSIVEQFDSLKVQSNGHAANMVKEEEEEEEVVEEEENKGKIDSYPLRPNAADCAFYIKTGTCQFGVNCRFNHPAKRVFKPVGEKDGSTEEFNGVVHDTGKIECKYFSAPGGCKYGDACRYNHLEKIKTKDPELNFLGLPIRLAEKDCTFYMRTGTCAYGANCRFNHPDPTATNELEPGNSLANGYSLRSDNNFPKANDLMHSSVLLQGTLSNGTNLKNPFPYVSKMGSYHQGMSQNAGFNQDQDTVSLSANKLLPHQIVDSSKNTDSVTHYERLMQIEEFPERAGQPDCDYFMKTGDCKYRSSCRYSHPISRSTRLRLPPLPSKGLYSRSAKVSPVETMELHNSNSTITRKNGMRSANHQTLQNGEFPERPGQPECEFFMKTGNCKYKSACRYHHPRNRLPTSSPCPFNEKGLPLRPGAKICRNYEQQGACQYGHRCLFNHPDNLSPTAEDQHHSSTNVADAANFEPSVSNNTESDWGDGWVM